MNMLFVFVTALILAVITEGTGQMFLKLLHLKTEDFASPIGAAVIFALMQISCMPFMINHGPSSRASFMIVLILFLACVAFVLNIKACMKSLLRGRMIYVLLSGLLLMGIFSLCQGKLDPTLNQEFTLMQSNIHAEHILLGDNPMQGYPLVGSFVLSLPGMTFENTILLLGIYANMMTVMLLLDIVDSFKIGNPWFRFTLILASVFYYQFYSWKIIDAFTGGNWRIFFEALLLYSLYQWVKTSEDGLKFVSVMAIGAGLFVSRGFLMIAIEVIYCIGAWMFVQKRIRTLYDISTFLIPVMIYVCCGIMMKYRMIGFALLIACVVFWIFRKQKKTYHQMILLENVLMEHSKILFYIVIPAVFLAGTFLIRFGFTSGGFSYREYLNYFSSSYLRSYLFLNHSLLDGILDLWRWIGLVVFLLQAERKEDRMVRTVMAGMVILFLNPFCMGLLARITGYGMYALAFEILLNPFTDVMIFYWIYTQFEWTVLGQWVLELTLIGVMLLGHVTGFLGYKGSLYADLLDENRIVEVLIP